MTRYYLTHMDKYGEHHQLPGAWEADTPNEAIHQMLTEAREEDDGRWVAHIVTSDEDIFEY
jgi:hypothetical protein